MIQIIEGFGVGAGKSYYLLNRIIKQLAEGGTVVITDQFGLHSGEVAAYIEKEYGLLMVPEQIRIVGSDDTWRMHELTPQGTADLPVLMVLDEAHSQLNARDWNDASKRAFFVWLTQSRHDDCDVLFSTQNAHNLDKQIARIVTNIIRVRNMANFKILGIGGYRTNYFRVSVYDMDGRNKLEAYWLLKDKAKFKCYDSKVMRGRHRRSGECVPRLQLKKKPKTMFTKIAMVLAVVALCAGLFWWRASASMQKKGVAGLFFQGEEKGGKAPDKPQVPNAKAEPPAKQAGYYVETFKGTDGRTFLHTEEGRYYLGEMCSRGVVMSIRGKSAIVQRFDGTRFLVATQEGAAASHAVGAATGQAGPKPTLTTALVSKPKPAQATPAPKAIATTGNAKWGSLPGIATAQGNVRMRATPGLQ